MKYIKFKDEDLIARIVTKNKLINYYREFKQDYNNGYITSEICNNVLYNFQLLIDNKYYSICLHDKILPVSKVKQADAILYYDPELFEYIFWYNKTKEKEIKRYFGNFTELY